MSKYRRKKGFRSLEVKEILFILLIVGGLALATYVVSILSENDLASENNIVLKKSEEFVLFPDYTLEEATNAASLMFDKLFYKSTPNGDFKIVAFSWYYNNSQDQIDTCPVVDKDLRTSAVLFDGRYISSLRAFYFKSYEEVNSSVPMQVYAIALFNAPNTPLDEYYSNSTVLDIQYFPKYHNKRKLEGCSIIQKSATETLRGNGVSAYLFKCDIVWEN